MWTLTDQKHGQKVREQIPVKDYFPKLRKPELIQITKEDHIQMNKTQEDQPFLFTPLTTKVLKRKLPQIQSPEMLMTQQQFFQKFDESTPSHFHNSNENSIFVNELKRKSIQQFDVDFSSSLLGLESIQSKLVGTQLPKLNGKLNKSSFDQKYSMQFSNSFITDHSKMRNSNFNLSQRQIEQQKNRMYINYSTVSSNQEIINLAGSKTQTATTPRLEGTKYKNNNYKDFNNKVIDKLSKLQQKGSPRDFSEPILNNSFLQVNSFQKSRVSHHQTQDVAQKIRFQKFADQSKKNYYDSVQSQTYTTNSIAALHHSRIRKEKIEKVPLNESQLQKLQEAVKVRKPPTPYVPPSDDFYLEDINLFEPKIKNLAPDVMDTVLKTISQIDTRNEAQKIAEIEIKRQQMDPDLFQSDSEEELQDQPKRANKFLKSEIQNAEKTKEPSLLKIEKFRIRKMFDQQIKSKMLEIKNLHSDNLPIVPDEQDSYDEETPQIIQMLPALMSDFSKQLQFKKMLKILQTELQQLILQQFQEKDKINQKILKEKQKTSPDQSPTSKSSKETDILYQLNSNAIKNIFKQKNASINSLQINWQTSEESPTKVWSKKKKKNIFQFYVRKHVLSKKKGTLDMQFLTRIVNLQDKLEQIFPNEITLGKKYTQNGQNLWQNDYLQNLKLYFAQEYNVNNFQINLNETNLKENAENFLFTEVNQKMSFYKQAKYGKIKDENNTDANINQNYFDRCLKLMEKPLPTFAKFNQNCLFLSEFRISDNMALALKSYLEFTKLDPARHIRKLYIDDCGMRDHQFAIILDGISQQKQIKQLIYSNNEFGSESCKQVLKIMPDLREFQLSNVTKGAGKIIIDQILKSVLVDAFQLQKLKLSHINLNDGSIVEKVCSIIREKQFITHLDVSWCGLCPAQLLKISTALNDNLMNLRNLNLGYNSLYFDDTNRDLQNSDEFIENFTEYIQNTKMLNHLDISGMNFGKDEVQALCATLSQSDTLISIHMSDNGLRQEAELFSEVLDMFGIGENALKDIYEIEFDLNRRVGEGKKGFEVEKLKSIVKNCTGSLNNEEIQLGKKSVNEESYMKHILQVKQCKTIGNQKLINQSQTMQGIGRIESNLIDQFVLSRKLNESELIFNQFTYKDAYFEQDSGELWKLSKGSECHVCQKNRYTMIFYDQLISNDGLIEIKDKAVVDQIKDELNLTYHEADEIAPVICGTVVNGGFNRKLRMLRADLFSLLTVCQSGSFVTHKKQTNAIKKGVYQFVLNNQKILQHDCLDFLKGWEKVMFDKAKNNQITDVHTINMPEGYNKHKLPDEKGKLPPDPECTTFVYAGYLKPGLHQFIIYCPVTKRAFVKDVIIDLNCQDFYPEFPLRIEPPVQEIIPPKRTRANVWRKWKDPKESDLEQAFQFDIQNSFDPGLFLKDPEDVENCKEVLLNHFDTLRVVYIDLLAKSPSTFPEIEQPTFLQTMLSVQSTRQMQNLLPQAAIENAFIRATRGDDGIGTLCRGEFMEICLRLCSCQYPLKKIAMHMDTFIEEYIIPLHQKSTFINQRKQIHNSKQLNQLLYDNLVGLQRMYTERKQEAFGFTLDSARAMFAGLSEDPNDPLSSNSLFTPFVYCQMFNKKDLTDQDAYNSLREVEFLELICRVALNFFQERLGMSIPEKVYAFMQKMWDHRQLNKPKADPKKKKGKRKKKFPDLKPLIEEENDSN